LVVIVEVEVVVLGDRKVWECRSIVTVTNGKFDGWLCGSGCSGGVVSWGSEYIVCLSGVRSRKLSQIACEVSLCYRKSWLLSKNMASDFAPELAKYTKCSPKPQNTPKWGFRVRCSPPQRALLAPQCVVVNHNGPQAFHWSLSFL